MKKGFTLIELLAVIAILAILLITIVPNVNKILGRSKENLNNEQIKEIENSARSWGVSNLYLKNGKPSKTFVTISELKETGFLEDKTVKDLIENDELTEETKICITYESNQYVYKLKGDC